jgi:hypothetical protein
MPRRHKYKARPAQRRNLNERPADLVFWFRDGSGGGCDARVEASARVSIGRTDSKRALGFVVSRGETRIDFVLDKDQVAELAAYLRNCPSLLKPLEPKRNQTSFLAAMFAPKQCLFRELEAAARKAHPECREIEVEEGVVEVEGPQGKKLVNWFKKNRPKQAARIERAFTKKLWAGS